MVKDGGRLIIEVNDWTINLIHYDVKNQCSYWVDGSGTEDTGSVADGLAWPGEWPEVYFDDTLAIIYDMAGSLTLNPVLTQERRYSYGYL